MAHLRRAALVSGNWNNSLRDGDRYVNLNNAVGNANVNVGSRLSDWQMVLHKNRRWALPLGKNRTAMGVFSRETERHQVPIRKIDLIIIFFNILHINDSNNMLSIEIVLVWSNAYEEIQ